MDMETTSMHRHYSNKLFGSEVVVGLRVAALAQISSKKEGEKEREKKEKKRKTDSKCDEG